MLTLNLDNAIEQELKSHAEREKKPIEQLLNDLIVAYLAGAPNAVEQTDHNINRHAGKVQLTQEPLAFQQAIRDEWQ